MAKVTVSKIREMQESQQRVVCVTAYDYTSAQIADAAGVDIILVGDSLGNVIQGQETTVFVDLSDIVYHTKWVCRGTKTAMVVADLPFGSYNVSVEQAVQSAIDLMKAGAHAVKLEGGYNNEIAAILKAGIPVMGHVGFTPQSVNTFGGFKIQGRGDDGQKIVELAKQIDQAGVFAMVLELIPAALAKEITAQVNACTIGIGAGLDCGGEIQVWHDVLGLSERVMKHTKVYTPGRENIIKALKTYTKEVRSLEFPTPDNQF
jgi:3-methyl-2-oxobutanoate hydroxymethyltransferase